MSDKDLSEQVENAISEFNKETIEIRNQLYSLEDLTDSKTSEIISNQELYGNITMANFHMLHDYITLLLQIISVLNGKKIIPTPLLHKMRADIKTMISDSRKRIDADIDTNSN